MKKIYNVLALSAIASAASAQQLPNPGFEGEWIEARPWNSVTDTLSMINATLGMEFLYPDGIFGKQPEGWIISNVAGVIQPKSDDDGNPAGLGALGATEVGKKVEGFNSESAVELKNAPNPFMATQIVPAYLSLGKTWATNSLKNWAPSDKDGGVFGGMEISTRPDALAFVYKRKYAEPAEGEEGTDKSQDATVLVYAWKGTWTQADVPANNAMSDDAIVKATMTDRDRNILGMETFQGGEVTKSDDAELIAKSLDKITGEKEDWTEYLLPIDYISESTPTKINVVIASNDYFDSENIVSGNTLTVDDVRFVYFSRLGGVEFNGKALEIFNPSKYEYNVAGEVPASDNIKATLLGGGKTADSTVSVEGDKVTIKVTNANGADADGESEHVYTFTFNASETGDKASYTGYLTINMLGQDLAKDAPATIEIIATGENSCTFQLPDFSLDLGAGPMLLGDIVVPDVKMTTENGITKYDGKAEGMKLAEGSIIADVTLSGTIDDNGQANMDIAVIWNEMPINVTFSSNLSGIQSINDDNAPVEFYNLNGIRMNGDNLPAGIYIRRQGNKATKIIVK